MKRLRKKNITPPKYQGGKGAKRSSRARSNASSMPSFNFNDALLNVKVRDFDDEEPAVKSTQQLAKQSVVKQPAKQEVEELNEQPQVSWEPGQIKYQTHDKQDINVVEGMPFFSQPNKAFLAIRFKDAMKDANTGGAKTDGFAQNLYDDLIWRAERESPGIGKYISAMYNNAPTEVANYSSLGTNGVYHYGDTMPYLSINRKGGGFNNNVYNINGHDFIRNAFHEFGHMTDDYLRGGYTGERSNVMPYYVNGMLNDEITPELADSANLHLDENGVYRFNKPNFGSELRLQDLKSVYGDSQMFPGLSGKSESEYPSVNRDIRNTIIQKYGVTKEKLDGKIDELKQSDFNSLFKNTIKSGYVRDMNVNTLEQLNGLRNVLKKYAKADTSNNMQFNVPESAIRHDANTFMADNGKSARYWRFGKILQPRYV